MSVATRFSGRQSQDATVGEGGATRIAKSRRRSSTVFAVAYLLLAGLSLAHGMSVVGWTPDIQPVSVWLRFAYSAWIVLSGLIALRATGRLVLRPWGGLPDVRYPTELLFECAVGSAATAAFLLLLSMVGSLTWWTVTLGACVVIAGDMWLTRRGNGERVWCAGTTPNVTQRVWLGVGLLAWVAPFLVQVAIPDTDHDSAAYHLPFARSLVHSGPFRTDAGLRAVNYPAVAHLFLAALYVVDAESAGPLLNLLVSCAIPFAVYAMGREFWDPLASRLAALLTLSVNVIWEVGITLRVDSALTFYVLMAVFAFLLWRRSPDRSIYVLLVGSMLGMGLGIKYTAVLVVAVLGGGVLGGATLDWLRQGRLRATGLGIAVLLLLVPSGFWYARNFVVLGDPLYPLLMRVQLHRDASGKLRPYHADVQRLMQQGPSPEHIKRELKQSRFAFMADDARAAVRDEPATSLNLLDVQMRPWLYARKPLHSVCPILAFGVCLPLLRRDSVSLWLYLFTVAIFLILAGQTALIRYVLPAFPLMAMSAGIFFAELSRCLGRGAHRPSGLVAIPVLLVVLFLSVVSLAEWKKTMDRGASRYLRGQMEERQWVARVKENEGDPFPQFAVWLDHQKQAAGDDAYRASLRLERVFLVAECRGYLLDSPFQGDMSWDANRWCSEVVNATGDLEAVGASLRKQQFSHILINVNFLERWSHVRLGDTDHQRLSWALLLLDRFINEHAEVVVDRADILLVRLKHTPA
jgi:4-amino-4-deoxy-L-arabinose transferase-like glycosyltransferase